MQSEQREYRWRRQAVLSFFIRLVLAGAPAAMVTGFALLLLRQLAHSQARVPVVTWLALTVLGSIPILVLFEILASRVRTLAALLDISMVFPYQPPSRAVVARTSPYHLELTNELDGVRRHLRQARQGGDQADAVATHLDRVESILTLAAVTGTLEPGTRAHSRRVAQLADRIALVLGLDQQHRRWLRWAALLHDVGKLTVPDEILHKPSALSARERTIVRRHVTDGARIIQPLVPLLGPWAGAVGEHHERWDGKGYPRGLAREEISLAGRIVAVADTYATMTKGRIYQQRTPGHVALAELERQAGGQFDPAVVAAFRTAWRGRRSPLLALRLPRAGVVAIASVAASLGLPAAAAGATLGLVGAVTAAALTAPPPARLPSAHAAGPIAGLQGILGIPAAQAPAPPPVTNPVVVHVLPSPTPPAVMAAVPAAPAPPVAEPPSIRLAPSYAGVEGVVLNLDVTVASKGSPPTLSVDFGDGSPGQTTTVAGERLQLSHVYVEEGSYQVRLSAVGDHGAANASSPVTISEYALRATLPSHIDAPGGSLSSGGQVIDPSADVISGTVDYGDGSGPQVLAVDRRGFSLVHSYTTAGDHRVVVTLRDEEGQQVVVETMVTSTAPTS